MKLLIGFDGHSPFFPVLEDLQRAGLPADCSATLLTVAKRSVHGSLTASVAASGPCSVKAIHCSAGRKG